MIADYRDEAEQQPLLNEPVFCGIWAAWTVALMLSYVYA